MSEVDHGVICVVSRDLAAPTLTTCSTQYSCRDANPLMSVLMGHLFRPRPWPSFQYHSDACSTEEPCSGIRSPPHDVPWFSSGLFLLLFRDDAFLQVCCCELIPMEDPFSCLLGTLLQSSPCCLVQPLEGGEYLVKCDASYAFSLESFAPSEASSTSTAWKNSDSHNSVTSITIPLVHSTSSNGCSWGNILVLPWRSQRLLVENFQEAPPSCTILVLNWLGSCASYKSCLCSPDNKYVVVVQFLALPIRDLIGNVLKRGMQPNAVERKEYKSNSCLCFRIHLVELEQCIVKVSYGIKHGLHPLCVSTSGALMVLLFEWPFSPCTEFLVGNLAAYLNCCAVSASGNCSHWHSLVQFEKLWDPGTKEEVFGHMWFEPLPSAFCHHWDPKDEQWNSERRRKQYVDHLVLLAYLTCQHIHSPQFGCSAKSLPPIAQILNEPQVLGCTSPVASDFIRTVSSCYCFSLATCALCVSDQSQVNFSTSTGALISPLAQQLHDSFGVESAFEMLGHILQQACCSTLTHVYNQLDNSISQLGEQHLSFIDPDVDACRREYIQAAIEGNQRWYSLCCDCSCDLTNDSVVIWVEYPPGELHQSLDPGSITMTASDLQPPKILMVMVISKRAPAKRAPAMSGMTSSTYYNQDHFQEGRCVIAVAAVFAQGFVGHECYLGFDYDCADNGYVLDWISIHHNYYFYPVEVYSNFDYHRDSDHVQEHRVHWDPGGCQWCRLGVKPSFKKGGMLGPLPNQPT